MKNRLNADRTTRKCLILIGLRNENMLLFNWIASRRLQLTPRGVRIKHRLAECMTQNE